MFSQVKLCVISASVQLAAIVVCSYVVGAVVALCSAVVRPTAAVVEDEVLMVADMAVAIVITGKSIVSCADATDVLWWWREGSWSQVIVVIDLFYAHQ